MSDCPTWGKLACKGNASSSLHRKARHNHRTKQLFWSNYAWDVWVAAEQGACSLQANVSASPELQSQALSQAAAPPLEKSRPALNLVPCSMLPFALHCLHQLSVQKRAVRNRHWNLGPPSNINTIFWQKTGLQKTNRVPQIFLFEATEMK